MPDDSRLADLLSLWQCHFAEGRVLSAAELCPGETELIPLLERRIDLMKQIDNLLDGAPPRTHPEQEPLLSAPTLTARTIPAAAVGPAAPPSGDWVPDGYEVLSELGRGGMGVVYQAHAVKLDRVTALKMILAGAHAAPAELARLWAEARAIARLPHPNVVQIYEVGDHRGVPYLALEFCAGGSLDRKLHDGPLAPREAAALVESVSRGVQAAHDKGVVHRDLKPANVLLTADGTPKITDFGLAKRLDRAGVTASGSFLGTPPYMAPEQVRGDAAHIGPLTDVYALGALLYECLTGRPPFRAAAASDTLLQVLHEEPLSPRLLQPQVPRDLEVICLKCLQKEPGRRYASARDLADDLARFVAGLPIAARPVSPTERGWRWCRRNPKQALLWSAVALSLLVGSAAALTFAFIAEGHATKARVNEQKAISEQHLAESEWGRAERLLYASLVAHAQRSWADNNAEEASGHLETTKPQFRGWEYHYLYALFNGNHTTLRGHGDMVNAVCVSRDGSRLASGSGNTELGAEARGEVKVWDARTGGQLLNLEGHTGAVVSVAFSPDGKRLAASTCAGTVCVWDLDGGPAPLRFEGHAGPVNAVRFSPDGACLATGGNDKTTRLWDARTGRPLRTLGGDTDAVTSVQFSPDGDHLAAGAGKTVWVWDTRTEAEPRAFSGHAGDVMSVCFSPDGTHLASAGGAALLRDPPGEVLVWDARTGKVVFNLAGHVGVVPSVCFNHDGTRLASAGIDRLIRVWNLNSGSEEMALRGHFESVTSVAFAPDGTRLVSGGADKTVRVWETRRPQGPLVLNHTDEVKSACFNPDGTRLATAADNAVRVWDPATGAALLNIPRPRRTTLVVPLTGGPATGPALLHIPEDDYDVSCVAYSPGDNRLAIGLSDNTVRLHDATTGEFVFQLQAKDRGAAAKGDASPRVFRQAVTSIAFSPDGARLAAGTATSGVVVWDVKGRRQLLELGGPEEEVRVVAFSPDGRLIAAGGTGKWVRVWDAESGDLQLTLETGPSAPATVCFSPDGRRLATAGGNGMGRVWDVESGRVDFPVAAPTGAVSDLAFTPDGKRLVGAAKMAIHVWDGENGQAVLTIRGPRETVSGICLSRDGSRLAAVDGDRKVWIWEAPEPDE